MKRFTSKFIPSALVVGSPEWLKARHDYVGASDVGTVLQLNPYLSSAELFHRKLGLMQDNPINNEATFWGHSLEDIIYKAWQHHTGEYNSYVTNTNIERKGYSMAGYYTTEELPFLTATPDIMIDKHGFKINIDGDGNIIREPMDKEYPLEIKSISGFAKNQWENGIPVYYLAQIHTQMICTDTDYAELAILQDGRTLEIYPIHRSEELVDMIIAKTTEFNNKLTEASEILKEGISDETLKAISALEPPAEGTEAYSDFLKKKYNVDEESKRLATQDEVLLMQNYLRAHALESQASNSKLDLKNKLLLSAGEYSQLTSDVISMVNRPKSETNAKSYFSIKSKKQ